MIPTTFASTQLIRVIGDLTPRTAGVKRAALASFYGWALARQKAGQKVEPKFYSDQTGIPRSTVYRLLVELEAKGFVSGGDTEPWVAVPVEDMDLSPVGNGVSPVGNDVSPVETDRVPGGDNTKKVSKSVTKKDTKKEADQIMKIWNSHAIKENYLTKHTRVDTKALEKLKSLGKEWPDVDLAMALDAYLKQSGGWMFKRWKDNERCWTLRAVLNFPTYSDSLHKFVPSSCAKSHSLDTLSGDPWKDHGIEHPTYRPPNQLNQMDPMLPLGLKAGTFDWDEEAEARRHYNHTPRPTP